MVASVEEVSSSLVREYLSRKGLKRTMACMDEEHPRTETSINNRSQLRQILNIEDLYRKNKVQNFPLKTLLEIIVQHHVEIPIRDCLQVIPAVFPPATSTRSLSAVKDLRTQEVTATFVNEKCTKRRSETNQTRPTQSTYMSLFSEKDGPETCNPIDVSTYNQHYQLTSLQRVPESNSSINEVTQRNRTNHIRGMMVGPVPQESNKKRQSGKAEALQTLSRREEDRLLTGMHTKSSLTHNNADSCLGEKGEFLSTPERIQVKNSCKKTEQNMEKKRKVKTRPIVSDLNVSEMVLDDIDEDEDGLRDVSFQRPVSEFHYSARPFDQHTATELKTVLLGSSLNCFSSEWINQGFMFSDKPDLRYGIVQRKGGPCGVLASIQAFVLKKLLFENTDNSIIKHQRLRPSNNSRRQCLVLALTEVLWRAGEEKRATVAVNLGTSHFTPSGHNKLDQVLEKMMYFSVDNIKDLQFILEHHIEQFETGMFGCILLTISALLSRSIEKVKEDMDVPTTTLIGVHGYCTQELVNLLLCGRAVSNVFDDDIELDSGSGTITLLKGIKDPCEVGLLSLFEHYNVCQVGARLKSPSYPIWVVCSESHFSVLFGLQRELLVNQEQGLEFDLFYYDGLANQQEEIRLTVSADRSAKILQEVDADLTPPLELCIRTRWKDASISWNDTEPIL